MNNVAYIEPGTLDYQILMVFMENEEPKKPSAIKDQINVSHSTLNSALQRLNKAEILKWEKYGNVFLLDKGFDALQHIKNHHHLIELFFMDSLDMKKSIAHEESLRLAPHFSCRMINVLCQKYPECSKHDKHQPFVHKDGVGEYC